MADVLFADDVSRWFEVGGRNLMAVREANFQIAEAELVVVLGRSGSGKSTLLSLCGGLDTPDVGRVLVQGRDVASLRGGSREAFLQRTVGWVCQNAGLLPLLTASENVALVARIAGEPDGEASRLAGLALEATGLSERADHREDELSGGERQRVALARALVRAPVLLIADEPTAQLDSRTAAGILGLIREAADSGTAVLMATHDEQVAAIGDRVLRMEDGLLTEVSTTG
ncbi:MAG TPA: ABC transporter ATP-binding protein [Candidatus Dormibacteraeota bacterium]